MAGQKSEKEVVKRVKCEVYSRIVGFLRPLDSWNPGKLAEWEDRVDYKMPKGDELADSSL